MGPGVDSVLTRHFEAPRLLVVRDSQPRWQFCHVDDLVAALELAALGAGHRRRSTVGCDGWMEQEDVELVSGLRRIELPASLAFGTAERLHRLGIIPAPASDLQYVVHPWVVVQHPAARSRLAADVRQPDRPGPAARAGQRAPRASPPAASASGTPPSAPARRSPSSAPPPWCASPGGSGAADDRPCRLLDVRDTPLSVDEVFAAVADPGGRRHRAVRRHRPRQDGGRAVTDLGYSAHPSALDELRAVAEQVAAAHACSRSRRCTGSATSRSATSPSSSPCPARTGARPSSACRGADRRAQVAGADLEAPDLRRRRRGMGRPALNVPASGAWATILGYVRLTTAPPAATRGPMSALVWLTIPVGALALALLWVAWATRTRPRADTHETLAAHRRFQAAFEAHRDGVPDAAAGADEQR